MDISLADYEKSDKHKIKKNRVSNLDWKLSQKSFLASRHGVRDEGRTLDYKLFLIL
jgi:hypothetical protein